jgi:hypothetical protein
VEAASPGETMPAETVGVDDRDKGTSKGVDQFSIQKVIYITSWIKESQRSFDKTGAHLKYSFDSAKQKYTRSSGFYQPCVAPANSICR